MRDGWNIQQYIIAMIYVVSVYFCWITFRVNTKQGQIFGIQQDLF